jgi:hypothetical protein
LLQGSLRKFQLNIIDHSRLAGYIVVICKYLPAFVFTDLIRLWTNGWITRNSFGDKDANCKLCEAEGRNEVFHRLYCPTAVTLRFRFSPTLVEMTPFQYLRGDAADNDSLLLQAAFLATLRFVRSLAHTASMNSFEFLVAAIETRQKLLHM